MLRYTIEVEGGQYALYLKSRAGFSGRDLIAKTHTQAMANDHAARHARALMDFIDGRPKHEQQSLRRNFWLS